MIKKRYIFVFLYLMLLSTNSANAALFDDKEARKKIQDVESTMQSQNQAAQAAIAELKKNQQALEAVVKGQGLADMLNQIETMNQEIARLKGELELANHNIEALQERQKDLYADSDARLRRLETALTSVSNSAESEKMPGNTSASISEENSAAAAQDEAQKIDTSAVKNTQEAQALALANGLSRDAKYKDAFTAYGKFLKDYPNSALTAEAKYGLGYAQYALKNYKSAIVTQQKLIDMHPESAKVPDALMNMGNSQVQLGQIAAAKKTYRSLIEKFPNSELIPTAQKRVKLLEGIK